MNNISISFKGWKHWSGKSRQIQILLLLLLITWRGEVTCLLKCYHFRIGNNEAVHSCKQQALHMATRNGIILHEAILETFRIEGERVVLLANIFYILGLFSS